MWVNRAGATQLPGVLGMLPLGQGALASYSVPGSAANRRPAGQGHINY